MHDLYTTLSLLAHLLSLLYKNMLASQLHYKLLKERELIFTLKMIPDSLVLVSKELGMEGFEEH